MFKSQLQEYAQKAGLPAPTYEITKEGPSHRPCFKATVTIQDLTYESPSYCANLKKAEHAAAEVALQALTKESNISSVPLHESGLCKNLLQEYAQKCQLALPVYKLMKSGETHSPLFSASVEIAGVQYQGGACKSKKEAEIKAAKTALIAIFADSGGSTQQAFSQRMHQQSEQTVATAPAPAKSKSQSNGRKKGRPLRAFFKEKRAAKRKWRNQPTVMQERINTDHVGSLSCDPTETTEPNGSSFHADAIIATEIGLNRECEPQCVNTSGVDPTDQMLEHVGVPNSS